jgi:hypothetical protein
MYPASLKDIDRKVLIDKWRIEHPGVFEQAESGIRGGAGLFAQEYLKTGHYSKAPDGWRQAWQLANPSRFFKAKSNVLHIAHLVSLSMDPLLTT